MEPLRDHLKSSKTPAATAKSLQSMAEGGWHSQKQLFDESNADDPDCTRCRRAPGSIRHRVSGCRANSDLMQTAKGKAGEALEEARRQKGRLRRSDAE